MTDQTNRPDRPDRTKKPRERAVDGRESIPAAPAATPDPKASAEDPSKTLAHESLYWRERAGLLKSPVVPGGIYKRKDGRLVKVIGEAKGMWIRYLLLEATQYESGSTVDRGYFLRNFELMELPSREAREARAAHGKGHHDNDEHEEE